MALFYNIALLTAVGIMQGKTFMFTLLIRSCLCFLTTCHHTICSSNTTRRVKRDCRVWIKSDYEAIQQTLTICFLINGNKIKRPAMSLCFINFS